MGRREEREEEREEEGEEGEERKKERRKKEWQMVQIWEKALLLAAERDKVHLPLSSSTGETVGECAVPKELQSEEQTPADETLKQQRFPLPHTSSTPALPGRGQGASLVETLSSDVP